MSVPFVVRRIKLIPLGNILWSKPSMGNGIEIKGTVGVIISEPPCKEDKSRLTTVPFKPFTVYSVKRGLCLNILKTS